MCSMTHETKLTVAVHFPPNPTVATAVLAKLLHRCTTVQFVCYFLVAELSEYKMMRVEHF